MISTTVKLQLILSTIYVDFNDTGALWLDTYETETFRDDVEELWQTLKPLYRNIHAYVRAKLRNVYGAQFSDDGLIPAHLLGTFVNDKHSFAS